MKRKTNLKRDGNRAADFLCSLLLTALYSISIAWAVYSLTELGMVCSLWQLCLYTAIFVLLCHIVTWNKITILLTFALLAAAVLAIYIASRNSVYWSEALGILFAECKQMLDGIYRRTFDLKYALPVLLIMCFLCALYGTIFIRKFFGFFALAVPGVLIFVFKLLYENMGDPSSFYLFLISIAALAVFRPADKRGGLRCAFGKYTLAVLPVCAGAVILGFGAAAFFDASPKVTASMLTGEQLYSIEQLAERFLGASSSFNFSRTGFNPNSKRLGGNVTPDRREVMSVSLESGELSTGRLYLAGAVKDTYDGKMWTSSAPTFETYDAETDLTYDMNVLSDSQVTIKITYKKPMDTFFLPLHVTDWDVGTREILQNGLGDKRLSPGVKAGESYTFTYVDLDEGTIEEGVNINYYDDVDSTGDITWTAAGSDIDLTLDDIIEIETAAVEQGEELLNYRDWVYETYSAVSDTVPERVYTLVQDITAEQSTGYEKLKAIESYLQFFSYTFSPGSVPGDRDFVDYFLFDSQEGYCTYFATAMCIMARTLGFPARYVEGYAVSNLDTGEAVVKNSQAHAWPEIYIDGAGWVRFEPTPAYAQAVLEGNAAISVAPEMEDNTAFQEHLEEVGVNKEQAQTVEPTEKPTNSGAQNAAASPVSSAPESAAEETSDDAGQKEISGIWWIIALSAVFLLLFLMTVLFFQAARRRRYFRKLKNSASASAPDADLASGYGRQMTALLALDGITRLPYESMVRFADRIQPQIEAIPISEMAIILEKAAYAGEPLANREKAILARGFNRLDLYMRKSLGEVKYAVLCVLCFRREPSYSRYMKNSNK